MEDIINFIKKNIDEKLVVEGLLSMNNDEKELKVIGHVKDFHSRYKNNLFDDIYEDENGSIIDLRICELKPTEEELENLTEYWQELQLIFLKPVSPVFVIYGERR